MKNRVTDLAAYRTSKSKAQRQPTLVSHNGGFYMSTDIAKESALGTKLAKVLGSPELPYKDRQNFRDLITALADAVEIDVSHPDIVERFWTLMVHAMKTQMRPGRLAHVRRREIEQVLRFEMRPTMGGYDYQPVRGAECPWPKDFVTPRPGATLEERGYQLTDEGRALLEQEPQPA